MKKARFLSPRKLVKTNAGGRKLMRALTEIIQAERLGGAGLTMHTIEIPDSRAQRPRHFKTS